MTRYACKGIGCPERTPVAADAPPTCYTCGRPMAAHVEKYDAIQRPLPRFSFALAPMRDHPAAARLRSACADWHRRVAAAVCTGNDLDYARMVHAARHPCDRPGCYLDDRPDTLATKRRMGDDWGDSVLARALPLYCDGVA